MRGGMGDGTDASMTTPRLRKVTWVKMGPEPSVRIRLEAEQ